MITAATGVQDFLKSSRQTTDDQLDALLPKEDVEPVKLHRAVRHSVFAGGKRFRPALLFAVGRTFGADISSLAVPAAAIEMIHTYSLIHDDLPAMDDDDLRRGKPTCHVEYGEATAILAGDLLQTLAFQALSEAPGLDPSTRVRLVSLISRAAGSPYGMVAGQQMDLDAEGSSAEDAQERLESIHNAKTGAMISVSAECGAVIAGASEADLESVRRYATALGLLFQITDDLLDVTETSETLGKTAGKDAEAEKATYPGRFGIHGARNYAMQVYSEASAGLDAIDRDTELLASLAEFILTRKQ